MHLSRRRGLVSAHPPPERHRPPAASRVRAFAVLGFALLVLTGGGPSAAVRPPKPYLMDQQQHTEDAHAVLQRAIQSKGGLDRLGAIKTVVMTGSMSVASPQPMKVETTSYIEYPDRFRQDAKLPNGDVTQVYAHGQTWMKGPAGVGDVPPAARANLAATVSRDVVVLLLGAARGTLKATLEPPETLEGGERVDVLRLSGRGSPVDVLVDRSTGTIIGKRYVVEQPGAMGRVPTEERYSDYRAVDGVQVAFRTTVRRGAAIILDQRLSDLRINVPLSPDLFNRPGGGSSE